MSHTGEDHPHIHGEHGVAGSPTRVAMGSPPYTWGARAPTRSFSSLSRITPIYMGSTFKSHQIEHTFKDHPHIHGEHPIPKLFAYTAKGSPPYTWGARCIRLELTDIAGITPIYMGSTKNSEPCPCQRWDHPHIHGEHIHKGFDQLLAMGSPPYTWGALPNLSIAKAMTGITPIYMGSTEWYQTG